MTLGWSDDFAKRNVFTAKSLEVVAEHFSVAEQPVEIPVPDKFRQRVVMMS
jgi:hypothetical protein